MSACYRIDPMTGQRTLFRKPKKRQAPWAGGYGLWDERTQKWEGGPYPTLKDLAAALCGGLQATSPARWAGEFFPKPLTVRETSELIKIVEDAG